MLTIFVIAIWSLSLYSINALRDDMQRELGEQQFATVSIMAGQVNQDLDFRIKAAGALARQLEPFANDKAPMAQTMLDQRPTLLSMFNAGVFIVGPDGKAFASIPLSMNRIGVSHADNITVKAAFDEGRPSVGTPTIGRALQKPGFTIAAPIRDAQGKVVGAVVGAINLTDPSFLDKITESKYGNTGGYVLVAPKQQVNIIATDKRLIMTPSRPLGSDKLADRFKQGYEGSGIAVNPLGIEVLASAKGIPLTGWFLVASLPADEAFGPIRALQRRLVLAALVLSILACAFIWWILRSQLFPVFSTVERLSRMADESTAMQPLPVPEKSEVGRMIGAFNRLLKSLSSREALLKASEARYRALVEWTPYPAVVVKDAEVIYANPAAELMFGASSEQPLTGKRFIDLLSPDIRHIVLERRKLLRGEVGNAPMIEGVVIKMDGTPIDVEFQSTAIDYANEKVIHTSMRDITAQKQTAKLFLAAKYEAEAANAAKTRFLAAASHDLRQPLAALTLDVATFRKAVATSDGVLVSRIESCVHSLNVLLDDLFDLSKLESGATAAKPKVFAVDTLFDFLKSSHYSVAASKGIRLRFRGSDAMAHSDPILLQRILSNLISNAVRFTRTGGVLVGCRRHANNLWVEVWDTGIGIAADKMDFIFEEFTQLGDEARNLGSGLGLSVVAKTAALMGLQTRVRSRPGRGSMFAVELPVALSGAKTSVQERLPVPARKLRIALVEDNATVLHSLTLALTHSGHDVVSSATGSGLLEKLGHRAPDIVISDYQLAAGETGLTVVREVRRIFGEEMPALFLTGNTDTSLIRQIKELQIDAIYKPVQIDALEAAIMAARIKTVTHT